MGLQAPPPDAVQEAKVKKNLAMCALVTLEEAGPAQPGAINSANCLKSSTPVTTSNGSWFSVWMRIRPLGRTCQSHESMSKEAHYKHAQICRRPSLQLPCLLALTNAVLQLQTALKIIIDQSYIIITQKKACLTSHKSRHKPQSASHEASFTSHKSLSTS